MQGRDMIGRARTGTGKTLAFGIPILDKILKFNAKHGFVLFLHLDRKSTRLNSSHDVISRMPSSA